VTKTTTTPHESLWARTLSLVRALRNREEQFMLLLAILTGLLTGLAVVGFILLIERLGARMYPVGGAAWRRLAVPVMGSLVSGWLLFRYFPEARGSGIPQTRTALELRGGRISLPTVIARFFLSSTSLATGIALGREGPSVQIGGGIASVLGQKLGLGPARLRQLIPVGAAAAIAAAFNTPIAAVLFTLEEVVGNLHAPVLGLVVIGSVTSWAVLQSFLGDEALFHVPVYELVHPGELLIYAGLGVAGGFLSTAFVKSVLHLRARFSRLPAISKPFQPIVGGVVVGLLGLWIPQVLGVGYDYVDQVLNGDIALKVVLLLIPLKVIATVVCYASGNTGGIFGPSLFFGAMLGGAVGHFAHSAIPGATASAGAYALVGMGSTFAGIIRTPMTSVFMIFELTRDYSIIVPVMICNLTSYIIAARLQPKPIYVALAEQDGIHLPHGAAHSARRRTVLQAMSGSPVTVAPDTSIGALPPAPDGNLYLIVDEGKLVGVTTTDAAARAMEDGRRDLRVVELTNGDGFPHVHPDHGVEQAMERMGESGLPALPVVDRADVTKVRGLITVNDVLRSYRNRGR
jgi:CIC family chloride channel protein